MVTSFTALRTHIKREYGNANVLATVKPRLSKDKLLVKLNPTVSITPMDEKFYKVELIASEKTFKQYSFTLSYNSGTDGIKAEGKLPKRYQSCFNALSKLDTQVKILKTDIVTDTTAKDIFKEYVANAKGNIVYIPSPNIQHQFGTYDIIVVKPTEHCTEDVLRALREKTDFRTNGEPATYFLCFLRRYVLRGRDSQSQRNSLARWYAMRHVTEAFSYIAACLEVVSIEPKAGHEDEFKQVSKLVTQGWAKYLSTEPTEASKDAATAMAWELPTPEQVTRCLLNLIDKQSKGERAIGE